MIVLVLLILFGFVTLQDCNKKTCPPCDCSGGTIYVIDPKSQFEINRTADTLLMKGDSVTGNLLKKVLMNQNN